MITNKSLYFAAHKFTAHCANSFYLLFAPEFMRSKFSDLNIIYCATA